MSRHNATPRGHLPSNGRYAVTPATAGAGHSRWRDLATTRWREAATCDAGGKPFATLAGAPRHPMRTRFDVVLLGMGGNGHTASLFPGLAAVRERERWVMAEYVEAVSMWRVTLTPLLINAASDVMFLVAGREKAAMLHRVLEGPYQPDTLPAQAIAPPDGNPRWLVDAAATTDLAEG